MRFGILGPLEVRTAEEEKVSVGGVRARGLLVLSLLDAGRVVGADRLIDGQYGDDPPGGAVNALQAQVSRLRRGLPGDLIEFHGAGYRLTVDPDDVDAHRFERLAREGAGSCWPGTTSAPRTRSGTRWGCGEGPRWRMWRACLSHRRG